MLRYETHDNGGRPFVVELTAHGDAHDIRVFKNLYNWTTEKYTQETEPVLDLQNVQVWIGKSPECSTTQFSGGAGPKFDGNSFLIFSEPNMLRYTFVGQSIFSFKALSPIIAYHSPVGNNRVPYPYAIDMDGKYYLMIENVVLGPPEGQTFDADPKAFCPYDRYYGHDSVGQSSPKIFFDFNDGEGPYLISWRTNLKQRFPGIEKANFFPSAKDKWGRPFPVQVAGQYAWEDIERMQKKVLSETGTINPLKDQTFICAREW